MYGDRSKAMRGLTNQIGDSREQMERGGNHRRDVFILEESCQVAKSNWEPIFFFLETFIAKGVGQTISNNTKKHLIL